MYDCIPFPSFNCYILRCIATSLHICVNCTYAYIYTFTFTVSSHIYSDIPIYCIYSSTYKFTQIHLHVNIYMFIYIYQFIRIYIPLFFSISISLSKEGHIYRFTFITFISTKTFMNSKKTFTIFDY